MTVIGKGTPSFTFPRTTGTVRWFRSPSDVIESIDSDLESTIAFVESGGTTFLSPILGRLGGIVCRDGTLRSHLAIVSREFDVPCLVGTELTGEVADGTEVVLDIVDGVGVLRSTAADPGEEPAAQRDVSTAWWSYIRTIGDEIAVKPFDLTVSAEALDALIAEELTDDRLEDLVQHMGRAFKPEMTRRSGFTSELFPMLPYMSLSVIDDFHTYAERVAVIDAAMPAEQIARAVKNAPGKLSPLWIWMVGYHYLCGRECLIKMGRLRRDERIEEIRTVVDFWRRLALAHRGDGTLDYKDAGFTNRYLPADVVDDLVRQGTTLDAASAKALKRLNATVSGYSFLYFCDSRVGVADSGPYPQPDGRKTIVRDYLSLGPSEWAYPWAEDLTPPYAGLTLALTYDPGKFTYFEINDWGTTFTEPDQLLSAVTEATVIGHRDDGTSELLGPDRWGELLADVSRNHMKLYEKFASMEREDRIFSATRMYTSGLRPFAAIAGVTDQIDWSFSPDTLALYPDPLDDDDKAATIFGTALVANDMPGSFSPLR
ncbi:PEP-utilising enzyme, mobile domain [Pseudonocardia thermophila]|jgi:Phosphoenolpyruvate-protein kinase (PTS system EI component in bacteria)|uniref:PEP-utilising enzyme, mobile domain n=1 Tax=Pseudonocardia thermophila TaxID=1848 RepID=A0A1M7AJA2_PSETH|nr:PEP-utilizing enzyme [Pseudonocardia thermophila]SHL42840.1 PEP-utilising enzyme, mobile domain [Pseudonocardia thermophila]